MKIETQYVERITIVTSTTEETQRAFEHVEKMGFSLRRSGPRLLPSGFCSKDEHELVAERPYTF